MISADQEPGSEKEIADFCRTTYGVKFPMMAKTDIAAPKTHPFYKQLIANRWSGRSGISTST
jgi:glutathione peroxidase